MIFLLFRILIMIVIVKQSSLFSKTSRFPGIPEVFWKEGSLERMGKEPLERGVASRHVPKFWDTLFCLVFIKPACLPDAYIQTRVTVQLRCSIGCPLLGKRNRKPTCCPVKAPCLTPGTPPLLATTTTSVPKNERTQRMAWENQPYPPQHPSCGAPGAMYPALNPLIPQHW